MKEQVEKAREGEGRRERWALGMKQLMLVGDRRRADEVAEDGEHVVVHGSRRYRLHIAWEVIEDQGVEHERQRALRNVKQLTDIFLKEALGREHADRLVRKWYELEDWLYLQLSMLSGEEGQEPPEDEADPGVEAGLRECIGVAYRLAAGKRWRELVGQFDGDMDPRS